MRVRLKIRCPNCGRFAWRHLFDEEATLCQSCPDRQVAQTECPSCDYLLVMCWKNGQVLEAHTPSTKTLTQLPIALNACSITLQKGISFGLTAVSG